MEETLTSKEIKNEKNKQSCWQKRSKKEKRLIIVAAVALAIAIILLIVLIVYFVHPSTTCLSPSCVKATSEFLKLIHNETNPCDDFYEFACGNFAKNIDLHDNQFQSVERALYESVNNRIRGIIEEPISSADARSLMLPKNLYRACLNQEAIDVHGLVSIQNALKQIGGWPVLDGNAWNDWNFEWKMATYKLRELGYNYQFFIALDIIPDVLDPSKVVLQFSPPATPLEGATGDEEELFFDYMLNISIAFGANQALAKSDFRDVIDFQKSLFLNLPEEQRRSRYDPLTISELRHKFSDIPWMEYTNRLIYPVRSVSHDQTVTITNEAYFRRLQNALRRISKRVVANYIVWRTVRQQGVFLTSELSDLSWNYYSAMVKQTPPTAARRCSDLADYIFPLPLQAEYVRRFLPIHTKSKVTHMLQNIKHSFADIIRNLDWLDPETRAIATERITISSDYVAYPNSLLDERILQEYYKGMEVDEQNFFQSMLQASFFATNRKFHKLHEPLGNDYELDQGYTTYTDIYYTASDNSITIPSGILQGVIYDDNRPQSLNYGALGSTLGHQVFHTVFEGRGCRSDPKQYEWLSTRSLLNFDRKLSCVEKHYSQYRVPEIDEYLNSSNTKYEDVADIAGVKLAYRAYNAWVSKNGAEQKLPGFDYSPQQLFWISSALRFCGKGTPESITSNVAHSYKSPNKFRVLGALRNLEEFSADFGCSANTNMNIYEKCKII